MHRRIVLCVLMLLITAPGTTLISRMAAAASRSRPNVVLIIGDDQSWTDFGFMGHPVIKTPNLDRLASESATFIRGYVPTALCRPSLASIITGLYPHQHGITGNDPLPPVGVRQPRNLPAYLKTCEQLISHIERVPTIPRMLARQGYASFQSGKWWEGNYRRGGFTEGMTHGDPARGGRHGDQGLKIGREGLQPIYDFIERHQDDPFFIWYAPFLPHSPHNPPERLLKKYAAPGRPIEIARYYAMCEWFDETCGQLLDYLDKKQLSDNTLVAFVSDNGWIQNVKSRNDNPKWRWGFAPRSKQSPYEGGVRSPIMVRWPGVIQPRKDTALASSIDLAPTILSACGVTPPDGLPGVNLMQLSDHRPAGREPIFGEAFAHDIADIEDPTKTLLNVWCIHDRWKLLLYRDGHLNRYQKIHENRPRQPQLFDLLADPREEVNRADQHPDIVKRLSAEIDRWWPQSRGNK